MLVSVVPTHTRVITGASVMITPNQFRVKLPVLFEAVNPLAARIVAKGVPITLVAIGFVPIDGQELACPFPLFLLAMMGQVVGRLACRWGVVAKVASNNIKPLRIMVFTFGGV